MSPPSLVIIVFWFQGTISPDENSQDTDSLDLEVVTSSVDSVLLRNIKNGALYRYIPEREGGDNELFITQVPKVLW